MITYLYSVARLPLRWYRWTQLPNPKAAHYINISVNHTLAPIPNRAALTLSIIATPRYLHCVIWPCLFKVIHPSCPIIREHPAHKDQARRTQQYQCSMEYRRRPRKTLLRFNLQYRARIKKVKTNSTINWNKCHRAEMHSNHLYRISTPQVADWPMCRHTKRHLWHRNLYFRTK